MALVDTWQGGQCKIGFARKNWYPATGNNNFWMEGIITSLKFSGGGQEQETRSMLCGANKAFNKPIEDFEVNCEVILNDTRFPEMLYGNGDYVDSFDSYTSDANLQTGWVASQDGSVATRDATNFKGGLYGAKLAWTNTATNSATWTADISTNHGQVLDISSFAGTGTDAADQGMIEMWVYVPNSTVLAAITTNGIDFKLGSTSGNYQSWRYLKAKLSVGWNKVVFDMSTAGNGVTGSPNWASVDYAAIIVVETVTDSTGITVDEVRVFDPRVSSGDTNVELWRVVFLWETDNSSTVLGEKLRMTYLNGSNISLDVNQDADSNLKATLRFKIPARNASGVGNRVIEGTPNAAQKALSALATW